jgi:hypothetical protein
MIIELPNGDLIDTEAKTKTTSEGTSPLTNAEVYLFIDEPAQARALSDTYVLELDAKNNLVASCRVLLVDAVELLPFAPLGTPEEQAILLSQITDAIATFKGVADPPNDLIRLATTLVNWRIDND